MMPPKPGMVLPESLMFASRFRSDAMRSPNWPKAPMRRPAMADLVRSKFMSVKWL